MQERAGQYRNDGKWNHFVAVADKLSQDDALKLEKDIFERIKMAKGPINRKYNQKLLAKKHRKSSGGKADDLQKGHTVYIAWADENGYNPNADE